jgi:hypothetical protein
MIPVNPPYIAERQVYEQQPDGKCTPSWEQCRVIGVTMQDDEPAYVVEIYHFGTQSLAIETEVKRSGPSGF